MDQQSDNFHSNLFKIMKDPRSINLAIGQPNFEPDKKILKKIKENVGSYSNYTDIEGIPELRNLIKKKLSKENKIKSEKVIVTTGSIEAIFDSILGHLKSKSEIILFSPHYGKYVTVPELIGAKIKTINMKNNRPDIEKINKIITKQTKMIILNSPCNPTSLVYSKDEIKQIAEIVNKNNLILLSDEVYEKFIYDDRKHISPGRFSDRVITINSFSKTYSLPGLRLGYLAGSEELVNPLVNIHMSNTTCSPYMAQIAAIEALKFRTNSFDLSYFDKRRKFVMKILDEFNLKYISPEGAFYFYIYVNRDALKLANRLLQKKCLVMPSKFYGDKNNAIRISYATDLKTLEKGLRIIQQEI